MLIKLKRSIGDLNGHQAFTFHQLRIKIRGIIIVMLINQSEVHIIY